MPKSKQKHYREYSELTPQERETVKQAFLSDFMGYQFRDRFMLSREAFRLLRVESRLSIRK
ncbi:hypothetical protein G4E03_003474 [Salmonella enterica]|nr:hypothetical protein [Salmonella enterica]